MLSRHMSENGIGGPEYLTKFSKSFGIEELISNSNYMAYVYIYIYMSCYFMTSYIPLDHMIKG